MQEIPPEMAGLLAQVSGVKQAVRQAAEDSRQMVVDHAWLLCSCSPWYDGRGEPAAAGCLVHGQVMVTDDGRVI